VAQDDWAKLSSGSLLYVINMIMKIIKLERLIECCRLQMCLCSAASFVVVRLAKATALSRQF
jgi:hypothetical protein